MNILFDIPGVDLGSPNQCHYATASVFPNAMGFHRMMMIMIWCLFIVVAYDDYDSCDDVLWLLWFGNFLSAASRLAPGKVWGRFRLFSFQFVWSSMTGHAWPKLWVLFFQSQRRLGLPVFAIPLSGLRSHSMNPMYSSSFETQQKGCQYMCLYYLLVSVVLVLVSLVVHCQFHAHKQAWQMLVAPLLFASLSLYIYIYIYICRLCAFRAMRLPPTFPLIAWLALVLDSPFGFSSRLVFSLSACGLVRVPWPSAFVVLGTCGFFWWQHRLLSLDLDSPYFLLGSFGGFCGCFRVSLSDDYVNKLYVDCRACFYFFFKS